MADLQELSDMLTADLFDECHLSGLGDQAEFVQAVEMERAEQKRARAIRTKNTAQTRRAKSEAHLAEILPPVFVPGESWHVLSHGDIDSLSFLSHAIKNQTFDHVILSTWVMALPDVLQIGEWIACGKIERIDVYVGEIFINQYTDEYNTLCEIVRPTNGRVCTFKNHSKIIATKSADQFLVIESSANINTNPRCENTVITPDKNLFYFQKEFFDGVKSFNRDFDNWKPAA